MIVINESTDKGMKLKVSKFKYDDFFSFSGFEDAEGEPCMLAYLPDDDEGLVIACGKSADEDDLYSVFAVYNDGEDEFMGDYDDYKSALNAFNKIVKEYNKLSPTSVEDLAKLFRKFGVTAY